MKYAIIVILILLFLFVLYALSVLGRRGHQKLAELRKWNYAHRGLHDATLPENSMGAFRAALEGGYGIELDVHLLADGNLGVMHDSSLKRTTGVDVRMEDLTTEQLKDYFLGNTAETIPAFREVLDLFDGKAPMIIELKVVDGNYAALAAKTVDMLKDYKGLYCIESFDPRAIAWLKKNHPDIVRGQLTEDHFKSGSKIPAVLKFILTHQLENFVIQPDFVAYKFADRKTFSNFLTRKLWGIQGVSWTLRSKEEFDTAVGEGWIPIFEGFRP